MNFYIKGYKGFPRIAKIVREKFNVEFKYEQLLLKEKRACFSSDAYSFPIDSILNNDKLVEGDIVTVDDRGFVFRLFSSEENDATIYLTGHCNSNCIMCPCSDSERQNSEGLDAIWMETYINMLPKEIRHIVVTGGEPTLRLKTFLLVMQRLSEKYRSVDTLLLTNGRSLAYAKLADFLAENSPKHLQVGIPLHGHCKDLHDKITQVSGSFRQTDIGIKNLLQRKITVEIRIVITKINYKYLCYIAEWICKNYPTVSIVNCVGLETRGNCAVNFNEVYLDHKEAFKALKPAVHILLEAGIDVGIYNFPLCYVEEGYWHLCKQSISPEKVRFASECNICKAKDFCGGFFNTTLSMVKPKVYPI